MEQVYQYIWKHKLWDCRRNYAGRNLEADLLTVDGRKVEVIYQGRHNTDAGPDFMGARLRIDNQIWVGNVEIHVKASDWKRHRHSEDPAYDNVILHAVGIDDMRIPYPYGGMIPQTVLTFPETFIGLYARMASKIAAVECEDIIRDVNNPTKICWLENLTVERMHRKSSHILDIVKLVDGDWQRACFIVLARALGFSLNAEPMEILARSIPLSVLAKHSDNLVQLEALLFGQAGMLDTSVHIFDEYYQQLCREYFFLARKYDLRPMRRDVWKFARTRPQNFPTRRIALLACALRGGFSLMASILDAGCDPSSASDLFNWRLEGYWSDNIDFDQPSVRLPETLSQQARELLVINLAAPLLFAYGAWRGDGDMAERGLDLWRNSRAENNQIIRQWTAAGIKAETAADSQALIQLRNEYCERSRCRECRFGHALLRKAFSY